MNRILLAIGDPVSSVETAQQIRPGLRERSTSLTFLAIVDTVPFSPLSPTKEILERAEAVFTTAAEKPGILMRVGIDPATEIDQEMQRGGYALLAVSACNQQRTGGEIDPTCRALLRTRSGSMFITPPRIHTSMTPQILVAVDQSPHALLAGDWLIEQCRSQQLNAILAARTIETAAPLGARFERAGVRTQVIVRPQLSSEEISALGTDRRVRWIVLPVGSNLHAAAPPDALEQLLNQVTCPLVLVPDPSPGPDETG